MATDSLASTSFHIDSSKLLSRLLTKDDVDGAIVELNDVAAAVTSAWHASLTVTFPVNRELGPATRAVLVLELMCCVVSYFPLPAGRLPPAEQLKAAIAKAGHVSNVSTSAGTGIPMTGGVQVRRRSRSCSMRRHSTLQYTLCVVFASSHELPYCSARRRCRASCTRC